LAPRARRAGDRRAELATALGERFVRERRGRHETFADAEAVLAELGSRPRLALVTNGAACLQREKLDNLPSPAEIRGLAELPAAVERL
jgi:putative hydrolase of the HAD superfamily